MVKGNECIYVSNNMQAIYKFDLDLNLIISINSCNFSGSTPDTCLTSALALFYDTSAQLLYNADYNISGIHVFDQDLNRVEFINLKAYNLAPKAITFYNGLFLIGENSQIITMRNRTLLTSYRNVCPSFSPIHSIYVYDNRYVLVNCVNDMRVNVLDMNLKETCMYMSTDGIPVQTVRDDENRILVTTQNPGGVNVFTCI